MAPNLMVGAHEPVRTGLFQNGDSCGDWLVSYGSGENISYLQVSNTLSNVFFIIAGVLLMRKQSLLAKQSGLLLIIVGLFSGCYHASTRWAGFVIDIFSMSIWGAHLVYGAQRLRRALARTLAADVAKGFEGDFEASADFLAFVVATALATASVCCVWLAGDVIGLTPLQVWYIWSTAFIVLVLAFALPALLALFHASLLSGLFGRVALAIGMILLGVVFTQLCFLVCVPGIFTGLPFHTGWHACAATSAYFCGDILDKAILQAESLQGRKCS